MQNPDAGTKMASDKNYTPCIFCAGKRVGDTRDHYPPRTFFKDKYRPNELVFPACSLCNGGSSIDDFVIGAVARGYSSSDDDSRAQDIERTFKDVQNYYPMLLEELRAPLKHPVEEHLTPKDAGVMNLSGPIVSAAIATVGRKLGFALHFHATRNFVPVGGGAACVFSTNYELAKGEVPAFIGKFPGAWETLNQGKFNVAEQFKYRSVVVEGGEASIHQVALYDTLVLTIVVVNDVSQGGGHRKEYAMPDWLAQRGRSARRERERANKRYRRAMNKKQ